MFKSKKEQQPKVTREIVTEKVETKGGIQTKTTTITCTEKNFDEAFHKLGLDPEKFRTGGTSVTKQIIYTNSAGHKEFLEETTETFNESSKTSPSGKKSLSQKLGLSKSPTSSNADDGKRVPGQFEKECLEAHNCYRKKHDVPPLTLSKEMCNYSKEWADELAATDTFRHRPAKLYGENIYMKWSSNPNHQITGNDVVDSWYSEIKDYTFGEEPTTLKSGHFSQVVWKGSKKLGVAWARGATGKMLVVANYDPPGNFVGHYTENVLPLKK